MNASARSEVPMETDHAREPHGSPSAAAVLQQPRPDAQAPPRGPVGPHAPDDGGAQTFVGGAGI
jgi:hypothetical protein